MGQYMSFGKIDKQNYLTNNFNVLKFENEKIALLKLIEDNNFTSYLYIYDVMFNYHKKRLNVIDNKDVTQNINAKNKMTYPTNEFVISDIFKMKDTVYHKDGKILMSPPSSLLDLYKDEKAYELLLIILEKNYLELLKYIYYFRGFTFKEEYLNKPIEEFKLDIPLTTEQKNSINKSLNQFYDFIKPIL